MGAMALGGILTAILTPFDADGRVNEDAFVALLHHLLENGSDGVVVAGTTGEGATLNDEEKLRLFELAVAEAGDATVIAGTGSNDTAHSIELTARAAELGVDGALVVTPYYVKPNRRGVVAHFTAVAGAAPELPIVVYNIPSRCVVDIPNDLLAELAQVDNISAVKQARFEDIAPIDGMDLLAGNDEKLADVLDAGGTGGICVASHLVGSEMRRMIDEPESRHEIDEQLGDVWAAMSVTVNPIPVKTAMRMLGHDVGGFRLPMVEASAEEAEEIRAVLERHNLLSAV
jgi:4-hydroxy-tetrahydrodipicolinate synthase